MEQHFKALKGKLSTHNFILAKIFFINECETKIFSDDRKLKEFITSRPAIKELLKEVNLEKDISRYILKIKECFSPHKFFKVLKVVIAVFSR